MPQSDGTNKLVRVELAYGNESYKFNINPQEITNTTPHRSSVVKTQGRYLVEDFNDDIQTITMSGTTGGPRLGGEKAIKRLWTFLDSYSNTRSNYGNAPKDPLVFYNHTEDYAFSCVMAPQGYTIKRSVENPLMWEYEINLVVLGYAGQTVNPNTISGADVSTADTNRNSSGGGSTPIEEQPAQKITSNKKVIGPQLDTSDKGNKKLKKPVKKRATGFPKNTKSGSSLTGSKRAYSLLFGSVN